MIIADDIEVGIATSGKMILKMIGQRDEVMFMALDRAWAVGLRNRIEEVIERMPDPKPESQP